MRAFVLSELRAQQYGEATGAKPGALIAPLTWVVMQLLTMSLLLCLALFVRVSPGFFAAANLLLCFVSVFSAVVVEFHEAALHPADRTVLGWRPLDRRTYAAARGTTLLGYVALVTACLTVLPAVVGAGQWAAGPWWIPLYVGASCAVGATAAALVLVLHLALGAGPVLDGLRTALSWIQIIGVMVGVYGGQLMLRDGTGNVEMFAARPPPWFDALPSTWLGDAVAAGSGAPAVALPALAAAVGVAVATSMLGGGLLARAWGALHDGTRRGALRGRAATLKGTLGAPLMVRLAGGRQAHAAFWLAGAMLRRDRELLNRSLPALATGAAAVILGLATDQFGDPLNPATPLALRALPIAAVALIASAVPSLLHNALYSRDHAAGWRLRAAPLPSPAMLADGLRRAMLLYVAVPSVLGVGLVAAWRWDAPLHALLWTGMTLLTVDGVARLLLPTVVRDVPFSRPAARGVALGPIAIPLAGAAAVASLVAGLASLLAGHPLLLMALLAGLAAALPLITARTRARLDARLSGARG